MNPIDAKAEVPARANWLMFTSLAAALASTLVLTTLAGCASPAGIDASARRLELAAVADVQASAPAEPAPALPADWWTGFGDPALSALVDKALAGSPSLRVAEARLTRAQAGVEGTRATGGLQGTASVEVTRQRFTEHGLIPPPFGGETVTNGTVQAGASWEIDFFGRHHAALEAALGNERAAEADVQAARVLLASNVARGYVQLARLVEQREVARRTLAQREEMLQLIGQRVKAGLDTNVELRQGEGALPETRQQLEALDEQIDLARHALAALTAQPPSALDGLAPQLRPVQGMPLPSAVPADLIGRRADISAARWRIEAATQDTRSLRAQFYPNVNLTAFAGLSSLGLDELFKAGSRQYGIGPAIHLPIFESSRLRAGLRGKTADLDSAVESYNAALIDAVREVADQISSLRSIERQQREQAQAQAAAESAYDLASQRYKAGLGTYLVVLSAESNLLNQRRAATDLRARALDAQVGLVRALGGGYADASAIHP